MKYSVYFAALADADLDDIFEYIALDSPENALRFIDKLESSIKTTLGEFPLGGKRYKNVWYFSFDNYVVVYNIDRENKAVYVHLITEGHRQWQVVLDRRFH